MTSANAHAHCSDDLGLLAYPLHADAYKPDQIWETKDHSKHFGGHWFHSVDAYHIVHVDMIIFTKGMLSPKQDYAACDLLTKHPNIEKATSHHRHQHIGVKLKNSGVVSDQWIEDQLTPLGFQILQVIRLRNIPDS